MTNQEILLLELGEVDEDLIPEISLDNGKHRSHEAGLCARG